MFLSVPVLAAIGVAFFALVVIAVRRRGARDLIAPPPDLAARVQPAAMSAPLAEESVEDELSPAPPAEPCPSEASPASIPALVATLPPEVAEEARLLLGQDRKLDAVKLVRAATGWNLASALEAVDRL